MKPIAVFILVAVFSVAAVAANAKTVTAQGNLNDGMVTGPMPTTSHKAPDKAKAGTRTAADAKAGAD